MQDKIRFNLGTIILSELVMFQHMAAKTARLIEITMKQIIKSEDLSYYIIIHFKDVTEVKNSQITVNSI